MSGNPFSRRFELLLRELATEETPSENLSRVVFVRQALRIASELLDAAVSKPRLHGAAFPLMIEDCFRTQFDAAATRLRELKQFLDARGLPADLLRKTDDARLVEVATGGDIVDLLRETAPGRESKRVTAEWRLRLRKGGAVLADLSQHRGPEKRRTASDLIMNPFRWREEAGDSFTAPTETNDDLLLRYLQKSALPPEIARATRDAIRGLTAGADPDEPRRAAAQELATGLIEYCSILERGEVLRADAVRAATECFTVEMNSASTMECLARSLEFAAACCEHRFCRVVEEVADSPDWRMLTEFGGPPTPLDVDTFVATVLRRLLAGALEGVVAPLSALYFVHAERVREDVAARLRHASDLHSNGLRAIALASNHLARDLAHATLVRAVAGAVAPLERAAAEGWHELRRRELQRRSRIGQLQRRTARLREAAASALVATARRVDFAPESNTKRVGEIAFLLAGAAATQPGLGDAAAIRQIRLELEKYKR